MIRSLTRIILSPCNVHTKGNLINYRYYIKSAMITRGGHATDQTNYIKTELDKNEIDWSALKSSVLSIQGSVNQKNIDAVLLKMMVNYKRFDAATSFADYLKNTNEEISIGSVNGLLSLYHAIGKNRELSSEEKAFILNTYKDLYSKYKILDSTTGEKLVHALCTIGDWKRALKVLSDIHMSCKPTHSAYSTVIATLFVSNKKNEALKIIDESVKNNRPLQDNAYEAWMNYILTRYKDKKTILKYLEDICLHVSKNWATLSNKSAEIFQKVLGDNGWDVQFTSIRKIDGQCMSCKEKLDLLHVSEEEFGLLQQNIKEKLIVGSDLFLKTSPDELKRFIDFVEQTAPYDIVLDALNIAFAGRSGGLDKLGLLNYVVDHYSSKKKRILLLGRKHMLNWHKKRIMQIMGKTCSFFTDDLSQDDPFFITAAILSGSHTDIVSKDLLRGHRFLLQDEQLRMTFRKWQWQHQRMVFVNKFGKVIIQDPLKFNPYGQKNNHNWHLPYEKEQDSPNPSYINDGTPNLSCWLCLRPKIT